MPAALPQATIDEVIARKAASESNNGIAAALDVSRNVVAGILYRLRKQGDARVAPAGAGPIRTAYTERDAVAEAFANGAKGIIEAARTAGLPHDLATKRWREVVAAFGWQAA